MAKSRRWHPSQESDELVFAVLNRFLDQLGKPYDSRTSAADSHRQGAAAGVAKWLSDRWGRDDLTREKVYPLFWEAARRNFLFLLPPRELHLAEKIAQTFGIEQFHGDSEVIQVVNSKGRDSARHVAALGADLVLSLIERVARKKNGQPVHIGLGAGYATMVVAKRLASRVRSEVDGPDLVIHALSSGGFMADEPQKASVTYFSYFEDALVNVDYVALFSETFVRSEEDYERVKKNPGVQRSFERASQIDIVVTSLAAAEHEHGMLLKFLKRLIEDGVLQTDVLDAMARYDWKGDVQFRPYTSAGPMTDECPVRAVTLLELVDLVRMAATEDKYVVLLGGPCGECGKTKTSALLPLLTEPKLRLWSHLLTDVETASELLK